MKRSLAIKNGLYILLMVWLLAACTTLPAAPPAPTEAETTATETEAATAALTITDGSGVTLTFDTPPQRIVCLYTRCVEVLAALDLVPLALPSWIAAVAAEPAYFPQPNDIIILAPTNDDLGFDLEELATLQPDLVLGWEELRPPLEGIAPLHAVTNDMDSYQESHTEIRAFAHIFGREQQAEAAIQAFLDRLAAYQARAPRDRSIINLWAGEGEVSYRDGASGTCNLLKEVAGCDWPDPENASVWSVTTSIEGLLQLNPDLILYDDWADAFPDHAALLAGLGQDPLWQELTAFKTGQIYETPTELYNLDGMGTVGAARMLDTLMPLLYPDIFPELLTDEQVQEILATGEAEASAAGDPVTATDMLGRTVTLPEPAERIVTLYSEPYAQILALGLTPVGSFGWPGQPLEAAYAPSGLTIDPAVQKISGADYLPDWELIAALEPDLVVGWGQDEAQTAEGIVPFFGMETYSETQGDTIADYEESLRALATLTGREAEAEAAIAAMRDRVAAYEKLAPGDLRVLHLGTSDGQTFFAFNGASINCGMIDRIADCAIEDLGTGRYADLTLEGVLAIDPDAILFTGPIFDGPEVVAAARAATEAQVLWPELRAVKEGGVYYLPIDTRPDSVLTIGLYLDTIVPLLYPDIFPDGPLTDEEVQAILAKQ